MDVESIDGGDTADQWLCYTDIDKSWLEEQQANQNGTPGVTNVLSLAKQLVNDPPEHIDSDKLARLIERGRDNPQYKVPDSYFEKNTETPPHLICVYRTLHRAISHHDLWMDGEEWKDEQLLRAVYAEVDGSSNVAQKILSQMGYDVGDQIREHIAAYNMRDTEQQNTRPPEAFDRDDMKKWYREERSKKAIERNINAEIEPSELDAGVYKDWMRFGSIDTEGGNHRIYDVDEYRLHHHYRMQRVGTAFDALTGPSAANPNDHRRRQRIKQKNDQIEHLDDGGKNAELTVVHSVDYALGGESSDGEGDADSLPTTPHNETIVSASKDQLQEVFERVADHGDIELARLNRHRTELVAEAYAVPIGVAETALVFHGLLDELQFFAVTNSQTGPASLPVTIPSEMNPVIADVDYGGYEPGDARKFPGNGVLAVLDFHLGMEIAEIADHLSVSEGIVRFAMKYYRKRARYTDPTSNSGRDSDGDGGPFSDPRYLHKQLQQHESDKRASENHGFASNQTQDYRRTFLIDTPGGYSVMGPDGVEMPVSSQYERAVAKLLTRLSDETAIDFDWKYVGPDKTGKHDIEIDVSDVDCAEDNKDSHDYTPDFIITTGDHTIYIEAKGTKDNANIGSQPASLTDKQKAEATMEALSDRPTEEYVLIHDGAGSEITAHDAAYAFTQDVRGVISEQADLISGEQEFAQYLTQLSPQDLPVGGTNDDASDGQSSLEQFASEGGQPSVPSD